MGATDRGGSRALPQTGHPHLYVAQGFYGQSAVYRFALGADGLPAKVPDGELKLDFPFPGSIAVGRNGDLYVSSSGNGSGCEKNSCFVAAFAPGASQSAKPIRRLYVPQVPLYVAVDQRGYLDVSTLEGGGKITNIYTPNAKGNDAPIAQITTPGINALGASHGIVYIQTIQIGTGVEGAAEHSSRQPVYYTYGNNYSSDGVVTGGGDLYAQFYWPVKSGYDLATAVYHIDRPGSPIRTIVGTGCKVSRSGGALGYGLAVYKKYLFEGCVDANGSAGAVLVYDASKSGDQTPIMRLPGGDTGVAVGP